MALHSRLICGNEEWVLSIIGALEQSHQDDLIRLYKALNQSPSRCTIDFSQASTEPDRAIMMLMSLQQHIPSIQIIGCDTILLSELKQKVSNDDRFYFG